MDAVLHIAKQTYQAAKHGVEIAIVMGGGNILRGAQFPGPYHSSRELFRDGNRNARQSTKPGHRFTTERLSGGPFGGFSCTIGR